MRHRVGKCPVCGERVKLTRAFVKPRPGEAVVMERETVIGWHLGRDDGADGEECDGYRMHPAIDEALERSRARSTKRRLVLVEPFRAHAGVAMDAMLEDRVYPPLDIDVLIRVALYEYGIRRQPEHRAVRFVARHDRSVRKRTLRIVYGDFYCLFCGELLKLNVRIEDTGALDRFAANSWHATACALKHLAFGLHPAHPAVRRLPDEHVVTEALL